MFRNNPNQSNQINTNLNQSNQINTNINLTNPKKTPYEMTNNNSNSNNKLLINLVRDPVVPDGTRGFRTNQQAQINNNNSNNISNNSLLNQKNK